MLDTGCDSQDKLITLSWVRGTENPADIFTKALSKPQVHWEKLGIIEHLPHQSLLLTDLDFDQITLSSMLGGVVSTSVLARFSRQLDEVNPLRNRWVVLEYCTSVNSGMKVAAEAFRDLSVICITEEENALSEDSIALARNFIVSIVEKKVRVLVWSSTPYSSFTRASLDTMPA